MNAMMENFRIPEHNFSMREKLFYDYLRKCIFKLTSILLDWLFSKEILKNKKLRNRWSLVSN